jgi:sec-independent protein translocase protein TatA
MGALQPGHLIVVLVIVLLVFGPGKLPELGKAVGDGLRELKKATGDNAEKDANQAASTTTAATTTTAPATTATTAPTAGTNGVAAGTRVCSKCNAIVPVGDKFCGVCGNAMEPAPQQA